MKVGILGGFTSKFGELWAVSPREIAKEAILGAIQRSNLALPQIGALYVGNMLSGILGNQANLGSLFADEVNMHVPAFKIEAACASGGVAIHNAVNSILAGVYKTVVVLGIEKMTDHSQEDVTNALMAAGSDEERQAGATFTGLYALMAQAYMEKYDVGEEDLASVSVKNHYHGSFNSKAQFQFEITVEDVLKSAKIADPLKLLDCSPISDGAAAIVISGDENLLKKHPKPIYIVASEIATDTLALYDRKSFTSLHAVVMAVDKAYKKAGIKPKDIDVAEIHDCFSISEIIAMEDLGFSQKGEAANDIKRGERTLFKGDIITNSSGGLKACGHPVGATGVKQVVEIIEQLRSESGKRQVENAKIGLTHNVGGTGAIAAIHVLRI